MINLARRLLRGAAAFMAPRLRAISGHSTGTVADNGYGVSTDAGGNLLFSGYGGSPSYGWVAKFNMVGELQWQRKQSMTAFYVLQMAPQADSVGNVYTLGGGYVTASPVLPHLAKYNTSGTLQWQRKLTAAETSNPSGLCVNPSGDAFISLGVTAATAYGIVAKYNTSGTLQWQRKLSGTYSVAFAAMAQASDGGIIAVGHMYDGGTSGSLSRGIVIKYDVSGAVQWQNKIHFSNTGAWSSVAVDTATGDIYICGYCTAGASFTGSLVKLNSAGAVQWTRRHNAGSTSARAVAVDPVTGYVYFWSDVRQLCCLDASGTLLWTRGFAADTGAVVNFYDNSSLVVNGGELLLAGLANHTAAGQGTDAVLIRLPANGGSAATIGYITVTVPTTPTLDTTAATSSAAGLTDAAGASTDAAGTMTDAAGALTFTNYD